MIAEQLINQLAEDRMEPIKDKLPENSSILANYETAEEYKDRDISEYEAGDYSNSIMDSLMAMHYYKLALSRLQEAADRVQDFRERIRIETEMMEYFQMVEKTIRFAQNQGVDVRNLTQLYNETKEAYKLVLDDLKAGDIERAKADYEVALEKKALLNEELGKVREELAYANADKIVQEFLIKGEKGIEIAQQAIEKAQKNGYDTTELQERLNVFLAVYDEVKALTDEGRWEEALKVMDENKETIREFQKAAEFIRMKVYERELEEKLKDVRASLMEMENRIEKDAKALAELMREGVDTTSAEIQLKVVVQELRIGVELLKDRKPLQAKAHFAIALNMLHNVDECILAHSYDPFPFHLIWKDA
ncbi:hypothetical protein [Thermococcus piezophilus]|uniref:hypothetical protein n=1 Tax=Thermococcus piezophilus TaxID=1712654 RepID=UPI000AF89BE8|nr:hypothetical protein [Thermococcus piezophilus]